MTKRGAYITVLFGMVVMLALVLAPKAWAACTNPAGNASDMIYNGDDHVAQYCDDTDWIMMGPMPTAPTNGLTGHWTLDETSGSNIVDSGSGGNDGTWSDNVNNDVTEETTTGQIGTGLTFDGTNDIITLPSAATSSFSAITVSLWIKTTESGTGTIVTRPALFGNEDCCANSNDLIINTDTGNLGYWHGLDSGGDQQFLSTSTINDNQWHHVAVTYDGTQTDLYLDGDFVPGSTLTADGSNLSTTTAVIGAMNSAGANNHQGTFDDARIYDRALSPEEIKNLYAAGGGTHSSGWSQVGNDLNIPSGGAPAPDVAALDSTTVAYFDLNNDDLRTYSFDGTDWSQVGNDLNIAGASTGRLAALDNNTIAYFDQGNDDLRTYDWDGSDWTQTGNDLNIVGSNGCNITALDSNTVAFVCDTQALRAYDWDGSDWTQAGNTFAVPGVGTPGLATLDSTTIAMSDNSNNSLATYSFDGTDWSKVGNTLSFGDLNNSIITALDSTTIVMHDNLELRTYSWNGTDWSEFGDRGSTPGAQVSGTAALSSDTIAYIDQNQQDLRTYRVAELCTDPGGAAGDIVYNADYKVMQFCNGINWVEMAATATRTGLVGHWTLNETSGTTVTDSSAAGNDGSMTGSMNAANDSIPGAVGTALAFDGTDDEISVSGFSSASVPIDFTVAAWVKMQPGAATPRSIFSQQNAGGTLGFNFDIDSDTQAGGLELNYQGDAGSGGKITGQTDLRDGVWHHVAIAKIGNDRTNWKLYVDGASAPFTEGNNDTTGTYTLAVPLRIGEREAGGENFDGEIDDVRIYNRELSLAEIQALYNQSATNNKDWAQVGNDLNVTAAFTWPTIDALNSTTVAYIDDVNDDLRTYSFNGTDWAQVGNDLNVTGTSNPSLAALDSTTIAFFDTGNEDLRTYSWDGTDWSQVGNDLNIAGVGNAVVAALDSTTVAYIDESNNDLRTYSWDGSDWSQVGNDLNIPGISQPALAALDSSTVAFTAANGAHEDLVTYSWDGSDWTQVGNILSLPSFSIARLTALNSATMIYADGDSDVIRTYGWDGTDWTLIGNNGTIAGSAGIADIAALSNNTIALIDGGNEDMRTYEFSARCTNPAATEGDIIYNGDASVEAIQFCNGTDWMQVGK